MKSTLTALALLAASAPSLAQDHQGHAIQTPGGYSAGERAAGLRQGRGMGLALPAEANGYPGPRHVLELAEPLAISADQRRRTQRLFDEMERDARRQGQMLLEREQALDSLFRGRTATPARLAAAVEAIAEVESALKLTHLRTHLEMMAILTPQQVARYVALRRAGAGSGLTRPDLTSGATEHRH